MEFSLADQLLDSTARCGAVEERDAHALNRGMEQQRKVSPLPSIGWRTHQGPVTQFQPEVGSNPSFALTSLAHTPLRLNVVIRGMRKPTVYVRIKGLSSRFPYSRCKTSAQIAAQSAPVQLKHGTGLAARQLPLSASPGLRYHRLPGHPLHSPPAAPLMRRFIGSYMGVRLILAGYLFPAMSSSHGAPSSHAWSTRPPGLRTCASPTAPPSVWP